MGHPNLHLDTSKLPDLLDQAHFSKALNAHLDHTKNKIAFWFQNAMEKNFKEWLSNVTPYTIEGNFESSMPNDINTMLIQQVFLNCAVLNQKLKNNNLSFCFFFKLDLINYVNDDRFSKETLKILIEQLNGFIELLKGKIIEFKINHFKNPEILKNSFTVRMVINF